jgi:hypothetical protein
MSCCRERARWTLCKGVAVDFKDFSDPVVCREALQIEAKWLGMSAEDLMAELARATRRAGKPAVV